MTADAHTEQAEQTTDENDNLLTTTMTLLIAADAAVIAAEKAGVAAYGLAAANREMLVTLIRNLPHSDIDAADQSSDSIAAVAAVVRHQLEAFTEAATAATAAAERVAS